MKVTRTTDKLTLDLGLGEARLFLRLLKLYPCLPPAHQPLSKSGRLPDPQAGQQLLDEALAEQRAENRKLVQSLVADPRRFVKSPTGFRLTLTPGDAEWLLQVLNDIRIGSWVRLGSPEEKPEAASLTKATARQFWTMDLAGHFQMQMLEAMERET